MFFCKRHGATNSEHGETQKDNKHKCGLILCVFLLFYYAMLVFLISQVSLKGKNKGDFWSDSFDVAQMWP